MRGEEGAGLDHGHARRPRRSCCKGPDRKDGLRFEKRLRRRALARFKGSHRPYDCAVANAVTGCKGAITTLLLSGTFGHTPTAVRLHKRLRELGRNEVHVVVRSYNEHSDGC